jgi:hypothetical protein
MNRILEVTDEEETLVLEFIDLGDIRNERILLIPARELTRGNSLTTGCFLLFIPPTRSGLRPHTLRQGRCAAAQSAIIKSTYGGA